MPAEPPDFRPLTSERTMYRFVHVADREDPAIRIDFLGDRDSYAARGAEYRPLPREIEFPELQDTVSFHESAAFMRARYAEIRERVAPRPVKLGDFLAEVTLRPGQGFEVEDLGEEGGHILLRGDPDRLVAAIGPIEPLAH
jgi:hypothetical protein